MSEATDRPPIESTDPGIRAGDAISGEPEAVYSLRAVRKSYPVPNGRLDVLNGVDLDVRRGDFVVIEGKSGVGKTTLLHIMALLDRPDSGSLIFGNEDVAGVSPTRRAAVRAQKIAMVFQFYHLLPELTAIENVMLPGMIANGVRAWKRRKPEFLARAKALLDAVGIGARAAHQPKQLSGGERQRTAIARALFNAPDVVLCDEPTGNLDVKTSDEIHALLLNLNRDAGQTFVVVTHDPDLARLAKRVVRIDDGRLIERTASDRAAAE